MIQSYIISFHKENWMKGRLVAYIVILILAVLGVYSYNTNPDVQKWVATYTEEDFSDENIYSDLDSLAIRLQDEIMAGSESFVVYLKDMDAETIANINDTLDGIYGRGSSYQQLGLVATYYMKICIYVERSTNYYVLKAYTENTPIPDTEKKAQQLYEIVQHIMTEYVTESMTNYDKEKVFHDYIVKNCAYSSNVDQPPSSDIYRAYGALVNGDAVCNGYAEALHLLLACAGIESRFVVGTADGVSHAWNLVHLNGKWFHLDATWDDPTPDREGVVIHRFFNLSDEEMEKTHIWKKENYPAASGGM